MYWASSIKEPTNNFVSQHGAADRGECLEDTRYRWKKLTGRKIGKNPSNLKRDRQIEENPPKIRQIRRSIGEKHRAEDVSMKNQHIRGRIIMSNKVDRKGKLTY